MTAAKVDPDLSAPVQRIHWPANIDGGRQYDDDEECKQDCNLPHSIVRSGKRQAGALLYTIIIYCMCTISLG